jgi:cytochrome c-type biogenesis protein CcmE
MKRYYIIAAVIIAAFVVLGASSFKNVVNHYVTSFSDVRNSTQSNIQVPGVLVKGKTTFDKNSGTLTFFMKDEKGEEMRFAYKGTKPGSFDEADRIVAIGKYEEGTFHAKKLLVKCPSKYQKKPENKS